MRILRHLGLFLAYAVPDLVIALIAVYIVYLRSLPQPRRRHVARLDADFRASDLSSVKTIEDCRWLEDRLFSQLREQVYGRVAAARIQRTCFDLRPGSATLDTGADTEPDSRA